MNIPSMRVDGHVALVTGGGTGIGQAVCVGLAQAGADVAVHYRGSRAGAEETCRMVRECGRKAYLVQADLAKVADIQPMVDRVIREFSKIDILVNNAGVNLSKLALETTEEEWDTMFATDVKGVFFLSQAVGRHMVERRYGRIVMVGSIFGSVGYPRRAAYASAKSAIVNMTRVLAIEWGPFNIRVNNIGPGTMLTPMIQRFIDTQENYLPKVLSEMPVGHIGRPEDCAGAVVFLCSPASDMITGETLLIDGGWAAH
jgi:NAD(P)-dependent dehydrogenase (short-subunit alcohol dehydrogenase family)